MLLRGRATDSETANHSKKTTCLSSRPLRIDRTMSEELEKLKLLCGKQQQALKIQQEKIKGLEAVGLHISVNVI